MTDPRNAEPQSTAYGTHRYDDHQHYDMRALDHRNQFWELANGILCALFLWAPMAAAAFQRAV